MPSCPRRARPVLLALLACAALSACVDEPTASAGRSGEMRATLVSPNGPEGSAVLEVEAGDILDLAAYDESTRVYWSRGVGARIVAFRGAPGEIAFRVLVGNVDDPPRIRVVQVGAPDNTLRAGTDGYEVALTMGSGS